MARTSKVKIILENHDEKEVEDVVTSIKNVAKEAWIAALKSRGLQKIEIVDREFEVWWKWKLEKAKMSKD